MRRLVWWFLEDESGATAIEYSILAGGIALVIVAAVNSIGTTLNKDFSAVQTGFN
jgi:pilus assembly protein Flp/PilA